MGRILRAARRRLGPAAKSLLFRTGALDALRTIRPSRYLAILRYHAVCGPQGHAYASPDICISPGAFAQHVRYLVTNYNVVSLPDAVKAIRDARALPPNAVVLTFDDGYADNLAAAHALAQHGLTATFYITAGCLAGGEPFWPSELRYLIAGIPDQHITLRGGGKQYDLDLSSPAARSAAVNRLTGTFKAHPIALREELRAQLRVRASGVEMPRVMLTWDEVREIHALGMTIGSHTMTHPNLPNAGLAAVRGELFTSSERLQREIGAPVTMFSYPNGGAERYLTPEVQQVVREAGYEAATTSRNGFADLTSDLFALERVQVQESLEQLVFALEFERFGLKPKPRLGEEI